jgi:hypothetical protein
MLVNDQLNPHVVHGQRTAEGAGFAHKYGAFLA